MKWKVVILATLTAVLVGTGAFRLAARQSECCETRADAVEARWTGHIRAVDEAIAAGDTARAAREWRDAWGAALASRRWAAFLTLGDAALRVGEMGSPRGNGRPDARHAYHTALFRAYGERSAEGVLRSAEAMAMMGDREMADGALELARKLARTTGDSETRDWIEREVMRITLRTTSIATSGRASHPAPLPR